MKKKNHCIRKSVLFSLEILINDAPKHIFSN